MLLRITSPDDVPLVQSVLHDSYFELSALQWSGAEHDLAIPFTYVRYANTGKRTFSPRDLDKGVMPVSQGTLTVRAAADVVLDDKSHIDLYSIRTIGFRDDELTITANEGLDIRVKLGGRVDIGVDVSDEIVGVSGA